MTIIRGVPPHPKERIEGVRSVRDAIELRQQRTHAGGWLGGALELSQQLIDRALHGSRLTQAGHSGEPLDLADNGGIGDLQRHGETSVLKSTPSI
jgi:hypothetical protein